MRPAMAEISSQATGGKLGGGGEGGSIGGGGDGGLGGGEGHVNWLSGSSSHAGCPEVPMTRQSAAPTTATPSSNTSVWMPSLLPPRYWLCRRLSPLPSADSMTPQLCAQLPREPMVEHFLVLPLTSVEKVRPEATMNS